MRQHEGKADTEIDFGEKAEEEEKTVKVGEVDADVMEGERKGKESLKNAEAEANWRLKLTEEVLLFIEMREWERAERVLLRRLVRRLRMKKGWNRRKNRMKEK